MLTTMLSGDTIAYDEAPACEAVRRAKKADLAKTVVSTPPIERAGYQPSRSGRIFGSVGTLSIIPAVLLVALVSLGQVERHQTKPPLTVTMIPTAPPPPETKAPQKPVEKVVQPVEARPVAVVPPPIVVVPTLQTPAPVAPRVAVETKPQPVEVAPPAPAAQAPAASVRVSHGPDKWEGRVLARLEQFRRYPSEAKRARQQGTVLVRFRVDRSGHLLSSSMERSSGNGALDEAAMETLRKADPLPKIPADRPDQIELVVPIEFTINR